MSNLIPGEIIPEQGEIGKNLNQKKGKKQKKKKEKKKKQNKKTKK